MLKLCILCQKKPIIIIYMNCGHALYCQDCYKKNNYNQLCEICDENIDFVYKNEISDVIEKDQRVVPLNESFSYQSFSGVEGEEWEDEVNEIEGEGFDIEDSIN